MKFKEIKPGMVIHCPTEEDKIALSQYLMTRADLDFAYTDRKDGVDYFFYVCNAEENPGYAENDEITEFSDLIEPDDSPMSAVEVLRWLRYADGNTKLKLFESAIVADIFCLYTPEQIIDKITAYEAAKKAPKPVKVKEGYYCDIYTEDEQILNYIMYGVDEQTATADAREKAIQNTMETGSRTFADVKFVCEEDES